MDVPGRDCSSVGSVPPSSTAYPKVILRRKAIKGPYHMVRLLTWFSEHKLLTAVIAALYVVAVILCHHEVSRIVEWMNATLSFKATNNLMLEGSLVIALIFLRPSFWLS